MKNTLLFFLLITFFSCSSEKLEISEAKKTVENLIVEIDKENYQKIEDFYTANFNASEPLNTRIEKLKKLKKAKGNISSIFIIDSISEANFGEEAKVILTYKIKNTKLNLLEKFTVVKEEGKYKVAEHSVNSDN